MDKYNEGYLQRTVYETTTKIDKSRLTFVLENLFVMIEDVYLVPCCALMRIMHIGLKFRSV